MSLQGPVWAPGRTPYFPCCLPGTALFFLPLAPSLFATLGKRAFCEIIVTPLPSPLLLTFSISLHSHNYLRRTHGRVSTFRHKRGYVICLRADSL